MTSGSLLVARASIKRKAPFKALITLFWDGALTLHRDVIAALPKLESLRIGCPGVTDDGFRAHILPLANLKQLDLTGSKVKRSTAAEWMNARPGRVRPNL